MSRVILAEAHEIIVLMSMLLGLSVLALLVAGTAVMMIDSQNQHVAALASRTSLTAVER
jgi:hypothetical protein